MTALDSDRMAGVGTHAAVARVLDPPGNGWVLDVGAGEGAFTSWLHSHGYRSLALGINPAQYRFPTVPYVRIDSERGLPVCDESVDGVVAIELLEHLENAYLFLRDAARCVRMGGWIAVTTPNTLSLSSKLSLVLRGYPLYFGPGDYEQNGHIHPLSVLDIERVGERAGLALEAVSYNIGKLPIPGLRHRFPLRGRRFLTAAWGESVVIKLRKVAAPQRSFERG